MNRLSQREKQEKRKIIKQYAGQMGHVGCYYLPKNLASDTSKRYYLVGVIDDYTRIAWIELISSNKSLDVMFNTLKIINYVNLHYGIQYKEMLSDNESEFSSRTLDLAVRGNHPFGTDALGIGYHTLLYQTL